MTLVATKQRFREFLMPDVGEGLTEAVILTWHVGPGDTVTDGQVVCEIETAKAIVDLPIPYDGVVRELRFPEGATVEIGTSIISIDTEPAQTPSTAPLPPTSPLPSTALPPPPSSSSSPTSLSVPSPSPSSASEPERHAVLVGYGVSPQTRKRRRRSSQGAVPTPGTDASGQSAILTGLAKPPVRKLAKDLGVDLRTVHPTGPGGTITRADVQASHQARRPAANPTESGQKLDGHPVDGHHVDGHRVTGHLTNDQRVNDQRVNDRNIGDETRVPINGIRKAIAAAMVRSAFTAPHVTEFVTVDVTRTVKLIQRLRDDPAFAGLRPGPLLITAKALLTAIQRHPQINAVWDEEHQEIVQKHHVNLGIAVASQRGLIVPNVKDAHAMPLPALATALDDLVRTARAGGTTPADMRGGTVTITNIGVFGVDTGTPILNPGETAILAIGAIRPRPWIHKGKVVPRQVTTLALSFDHRLADGELGSRVLADIAAVLERPKRLIAWS